MILAENPRITELKLYKGFKINKVETFSNLGKVVTYEAEIKKYGEYIQESSLKKCKHEIDILIPLIEMWDAEEAQAEMEKCNDEYN